MSPLFLFPSAQFPNGSSMDPQHSKWYHPFIFRISQHFKHVQLLIISWPSWPSRHMRTSPIYASYLLSMPIICQKSNNSPFKYNILPLYILIRLLSICTRIAQKITWMSCLIVNLVQKTEIFFHTFKVFTAEVSTIEPTTMMKEGWSKGHQSPYYWASSQCWSKFLLPVIDFVIIFPVLMCCPAKGRHYGEVLFNLL